MSAISRRDWAAQPTTPGRGASLAGTGRRCLEALVTNGPIATDDPSGGLVAAGADLHHNNADSLTLAQFKRGAAWFRAGMPDFHITIDDMVAEADRVAVRFTGRGTHLGSLFGEDPTSKSITVYGSVIYRLRDGRVVKDWETLDEHHLRQQVGAVAGGRQGL